jgi:hypothetical protein
MHLKYKNHESLPILGAVRKIVSDPKLGSQFLSGFWII